MKTMVTYTLEGNKIKAEFDWKIKYTCPRAQWQVEIGKLITKVAGEELDLYPLISKVLFRKRVFWGTAQYGDIPLDQAKEYAKKNLLKKYKKAVLDCLTECIVHTASSVNKLANFHREVLRW